MSRTQLGYGLQKCFEAAGRVVAEGGMVPLGIVIGGVVADFQPRFGQPGKAAAVKQFGFKAAPKRFGEGRTR